MPKRLLQSEYRLGLVLVIMSVVLFAFVGGGLAYVGYQAYTTAEAVEKQQKENIILARQRRVDSARSQYINCAMARQIRLDQFDQQEKDINSGRTHRIAMEILGITDLQADRLIFFQRQQIIKGRKKYSFLGCITGPNALPTVRTVINERGVFEFFQGIPESLQPK